MGTDAAKAAGLSIGAAACVVVVCEFEVMPRPLPPEGGDAADCTWAEDSSIGTTVADGATVE